MSLAPSPQLVPPPLPHDLGSAWRTEAARSVGERLPGAFLILVAVLLIAWVPEHAGRPQRTPAYALTLLAEMIIGVVTVAIARRYRERPAIVLNAAAAGTLGIALMMAAYHLWLRGELELLAMAFSFILFGTASVLPWGARRQALLGTIMAGVVLAAALVVPAIVSTGVAVFAAAASAAVTVYGAALGERQLRGLLARDLALEEANAHLRAASLLKSEFVAAVSHELRSPLNVILGYVDMLLDASSDRPDAPEREPLLRIRRNAEELHTLVSTTLDLARLEQGSVDIALTPVGAREILERLRQTTAELQVHSDLRFVWSCDEGLPPLQTDAAKVLVVLKNLLTNAVKFTERGTITVGASPRDDGVEFRVQDTGPGIPPEAQRQIFEAFRQGPDAAARSAGGVGLGLHIVRRLVDLLGGQVTLESAPARGSTFRVWLPARGPAAVTPQSESG